MTNEVQFFRTLSLSNRKNNGGFMRFFVLLSLISFELFADSTIQTSIVDIDYGQELDQETLVFLENGLVTKISEKYKEKILPLLNHKSTQGIKPIYRVTYDKDRFIQSIEEINQEKPKEQTEFVSKINTKYIPTTIESMDVAKKYFREARRTWKEETQCFNRAMVWTYEWWLEHSLKSNKILVFFSRNFIRRFNFEWWFHIAPYVHVKDGETVVERVMDVKYSSGPISFQRWTDIFTRGRKYVCPIITKYSDYADYPYTGECYLYRTNMYTYQPADLEMAEAWNYEKNNFIYEEVKGAYLEAFGINI